ncbi:MAG TPA: hypothetical protein PL110_21630, partial [Candidatus Eremiobacteraeota bacterium]|nr:hypothetical protein [Candidatus Eremiobacteraeota bacterium]
LFLSQILYPDILEYIYLSFKQAQLITMSLGVISVILISQRNLSSGWRLIAILISLLISLEVYFMSKRIF